ncbi:MAG: DUF2721 domain-containing protein [Candidatus Aminicenantaceae bacterium]
MAIDNIELFIRLLQLSVVPVVLISGVGLLLLTFTNRLGRTIDRSRILAREMDVKPEDERWEIREQCRILVKRSQMLRQCISFASLSIFFSSAMIIGLFFLLFLGWPTKYFILSAFFFSMLSLILAVVIFLLDITLTLKALRLEVNKFLN